MVEELLDSGLGERGMALRAGGTGCISEAFGETRSVAVR